MKSNYESQLDALKIDLKRIQDEEIVRYQKRLSDLQMTVDPLESQVCRVRSLAR